MSRDESRRIEEALMKDGRYPLEAYAFLHRGLEYTTQVVHGSVDEDEEDTPSRHVSGRELCEGLRQCALDRWGPLAKPVLNSWNIVRTRDFGEMVYFLISLGALGKQESDSIEDFDDVYDFEEAFGGYRIPLDDADDDDGDA